MTFHRIEKINDPQSKQNRPAATRQRWLYRRERKPPLSEANHYCFRHADMRRAIARILK